MSIQENNRPTDSASADDSEPYRAFQWLGRISTILCGLVMVAIVATTAWYFRLAEGASSGLALLITYVVYIPLLSIPVAVVCLGGMFLSGLTLLD